MKKKIRKDSFEAFISLLQESYRLIGPAVDDGVVVMREIVFDDIPAGYRDHQSPGSYRLSKGDDADIFSFAPGPDSFKRVLHPPEKELFAFRRGKSGIVIDPLPARDRPVALLGVRGCDLTALKLYDRVFLEGPVQDRTYHHLRSNSLIIAFNCLFPGDTCFCASLGTGPEVKDYFDICMTELEDSFLLEAATERGKEMVGRLSAEAPNDADWKGKRMRVDRCARMMKKTIAAHELPDIIYRNLDHPCWNEIAARDLECGNCTQVCPTCFCNSIYEIPHLDGLLRSPPETSGVRVRKWDSCFSTNFASVHGGNFRYSRSARYRHWISHKLAYTGAQFGLPGCVGCGRCITWCPAGIDITEELEALRNVR
ncbi:MAG: 4Fe-4S dicluster domain-containing protein [Nitrospirota bacterium]